MGEAPPNRTAAQRAWSRSILPGLDPRRARIAAGKRNAFEVTSFEDAQFKSTTAQEATIMINVSHETVADATKIFTNAVPATMLDHALYYASLGWHVFPVPPGTKRSYKSRDYFGTRWGATPDPDEIRRDFYKWPDANVGRPSLRRRVRFHCGRG